MPLRWLESPGPGIPMTKRRRSLGDGRLELKYRKASDSNPYSIPLFQSCNDPPGKVLALVLAAMLVKVHDLSPMTELDIHTAFSSAIAGELRPPPLIRVIDRVGTHWVYLACPTPERKPHEKPSRDCHYIAAWICAPTTRFLRQVFDKREQSTALFTVGHHLRLIDLSWKDGRTLFLRSERLRSPDL